MSNKRILSSFLLLAFCLFPIILFSQNSAETKPLFRLRNDKIQDHFYTSNEATKNNFVANKNYRFESIIGKVYVNQVDNTLPLYQLYSPSEKNHFYTVSNTYKKLTTRKHNPYRYEGIVGYVYPERTNGAIPLYRLRSDSQKNHFYTVNSKEKDNATKKGYRYERIECYILPSSTTPNSKMVIKEIVVSGKKSWTDTGIEISKGQEIHINATGSVWANKSTECSPDGVYKKKWEKYCVIKNVNHEALIGKIGNNGIPFLVGAQISLIPKQAGRLYLGVNDKDIRNNKGAFNVIVKYSQIKKANDK